MISSLRVIEVDLLLDYFAGGKLRIEILYIFEEVIRSLTFL